MTTLTKLENNLHHHKLRVQRITTFSRNADPPEIKNIIGRFTAAMSANFACWVGAAAVFCKSPECREAATQNFRDEISGNHSDMLEDFAASLEATPTAENFEQVHGVVSQVRNLIAHCDGLKIATLMTFLEGTSDVIMPALSELSEKLKPQGSQHPYMQLHSAVDGEHADLFIKGLKRESIGHDNLEKTILEVELLIIKFWRKIFKAQK